MIIRLKAKKKEGNVMELKEGVVLGANFNDFRLMTKESFNKIKEAFKL